MNEWEICDDCKRLDHIHTHDPDIMSNPKMGREIMYTTGEMNFNYDL